MLPVDKALWIMVLMAVCGKDRPALFRQDNPWMHWSGTFTITVSNRLRLRCSSAITDLHGSRVNGKMVLRNKPQIT